MTSVYRALGLCVGSFNLAMSSQLEDLAGWPDAKALGEGTWAWQDAPHVVWGKEALFFDQGHVDADGHRVFAEEVAEWIQAKGLLD